VDSRTQIEQIMRAQGGVIARRDHPELWEGIRWLAGRDELAPILPGIYTAAGAGSDVLTRIAAVRLASRDAVLTGASAARLTYWPEAPTSVVTASLPTARVGAPGISFERRIIPPELIVERRGLRVTAPALTALDMSSLDFSEPLDVALRKRVVTLARLHEALRLTSGRRGNSERRCLVLDSREGPWSYAERLGHRLLWGAGITGWQANMPFNDIQGNLFFLDVGFKRLKLAIEIDGRIHERDRGLFESDRWRQNALVLAGWRVLRFTVQMLEDRPDLVLATIREALAH
jgi:Protein of unknown function (DUF559)